MSVHQWCRDPKASQNCASWNQNHIPWLLASPSAFSSTEFALSCCWQVPFCIWINFVVSSTLLVCVLVENFQKLQQAKETLTNEESRARYDYWRRSKVTIPFQQWEALSSSVKTVGGGWVWALRRTGGRAGPDKKLQRVRGWVTALLLQCQDLERVESNSCTMDVKEIQEKLEGFRSPFTEGC